MTGEPAAIAYLTTHYPAVSHTFIQNEVRALRASGHRIVTFSINRTDEAHALTDADRAEQAATIALKALPARVIVWTALSAAVRHPLALASTLRLAWRGVGPDLSRGVRRTMQAGEALLLARQCRRQHVQHVHAHFGQAPANIAWFATHYNNTAHRARPLRWSMTIHGPQDCLGEPPHLLQAKTEAASFVVAVADYTRAQLIRQIPLALWAKVHVVRCGVDVQAPAVAVADRANDVFTALIVARISPEKGHATALQALALLNARGVRVALEIVGPGDFEAGLGALADELGVRSQVRVVGALPPAAVAARMRAVDALCLPSYAEGLPVTLMEALVAGAPVVASGICGVPELIRDGVTGLTVVPARPDLLADALATLAADPALRQRLATAGREAVCRLHDGERSASELGQLFASYARRDPATSGEATSGRLT